MTTPDSLRAVSVRQPWAHALIHLGKPIENRSRTHPHRGTTLIHASAGMTGDEYVGAINFMTRHTGTPRSSIPAPPDLARGGIIGAVDIVDCVGESTSPWWMGPRGFVCINPRPVPFIACRGTVTPLFWVPPPDVLSHCRAALGLPD